MIRVCSYPDVKGVAQAAADLIGRAVALDPQLVLGLATGRTVIPLYAELATRHLRREVDLSRARGLNLDELLIPADHPASFRHFMEEHVWAPVGFRRHLCAIPDSTAEPSAECERYQRLLDGVGGFDLAIVGVGADGHVAYNLPGQANPETHTVSLPDDLADQLNVPQDSRPLEAISVGMGAFRKARHLLMLATTIDKAPALAALLAGTRDPDWPCSELAEHPNFDLLLTDAVAAEVRALGWNPGGDS